MVCLSETPTTPRPDAFLLRRSIALLVSVLLHALFVAALCLLTPLLYDLDRQLADSVADTIEQNRRQQRIRWYRFDSLPQVRNPDSQPSQRQARGQLRSSEEIVVDRPHSSNVPQLIEQRQSKTLITEQIPAPNIIRQTPADSLAPQLAKLPRRTAPLPAPTSPAVTESRTMEVPPALQQSAKVSDSPSQMQIARLAKPAPKRFVPPEAKAPPNPATTLDWGASPELSATQSASLSSPVGPPLSQVPKLPARRFVPPGSASGTANNKASGSNLEAPPQLSASATAGAPGGKDAADLVVLSLRPLPGQPPGGVNLPGGFSQARETGTPAHVDNTSKGAYEIRGASTRPSQASVGSNGLRLPTPEELLGEEVKDEYFEIRFDIAQRFPRLSSPLSPSSRLLPRNIEKHFAGRSVFVVVVPMDGVDRYAGDWILWFSDAVGNNATRSANIKMTAPLPFWKLETRRWLAPRGEKSTEIRIQVRFVINREGRLSVRELLTRTESRIDALILNDLQRWVFVPARLEGKVIESEAIAEIPFRLPVSLPNQ